MGLYFAGICLVGLVVAGIIAESVYLVRNPRPFVLPSYMPRAGLVKATVSQPPKVDIAREMMVDERMAA